MGGVVPTATDDVCIGNPTGGTYSVTLDGPVAVHTLTLGGGGTGVQTLVVRDGSLVFGDASVINANGAIVLTASTNSGTSGLRGPGALTNLGTVATVQGGGGIRRLDVALVNHGVVNLGASDNRADAPTTMANDGSFTITAGATLAVSDGMSFVSAGGALQVNGALSQRGGSFTLAGGTVTGAEPALDGVTLTDSAGAGSFNLSGDSALDGSVPSGQSLSVVAQGNQGATLTVLGSVVTNTGSILLSGTGTGSASLQGGLLDNAGALQLQAGGGARVLGNPVINERGGTVDVGSSTAQAQRALTNYGTVRLHDGGQLGLGPEGSLTQGTAGELSLGIDSVQGASSITGGAIACGGVLDLVTTGVPAVGTTYPLLTGGVSGKFASVVSAGPVFSLAPSSSSLQVEVGPAPTLAVSPASPQAYGTTLTMTSSMEQPGATGTVQFSSDPGAGVGSPVALAEDAASLASGAIRAGLHQLTAAFIPGDPTRFSRGISPAVPYLVAGGSPAGSQVSLAVDTGLALGYSDVTFTATVSPTALAGSVTFQESPTGPVIGTTAEGSGAFVFSTQGLAPGSYGLQAVFNPRDAATSGSSSPLVPLVLASPAGGGSAATSVAPSDGNLSITTPFGPTSPLEVGELALDPTGTEFTAAVPIGGIVITDGRAAGRSVTVTVQASDLDSGPAGISGQNVGLVSTQSAFTPAGQTTAVAVPTMDSPSASPPVAAGTAGTLGLGGPPHAVLDLDRGQGSFTLQGMILIVAPSSTPAGVYTGSISITVG